MKKKKNSRSKFLHAHDQYVLMDSAKYQNVSTNTFRQVNFIMHALPQVNILKPHKTQLLRITKNWLSEKRCCFDENDF